MKAILFYSKKNAKKNIYSKIFVTFLILLVFPLLGKAQTFTAGNLAVFQAASASGSNTTGSILELSPTTLNQASPVHTYSILGTGSTPLRFSGSAGTTGYLVTSNDGSLLCFSGANTTNTSSNTNSILPRGVGTLNSNLTFALAATYTGVSSNQSRGATTLNNTNFYIADQYGMYTNGATSPSPTTNFRCLKAFGGIVYGFVSSTTSPPVGTVSALTGGSFTALTGLANGTANNSDFYMLSSGSNGSSYDILYIIAQSSATAGTIFKYSLVSGSWVANGSYTTSFGGFSICASKSGKGAYLYVTTGNGSTAANSVYRLTDANGYNTAISLSSQITLYATTGTNVIKGISFAPQVNAPVVSTGTTTNVNISTATCAGNVISDGGSTVTARGICYSSTANPDTTSSKVSSSGTTGSYTANISGLSALTTYHYRAYAQNTAGVTYGVDSTFTTLNSLVPTKLAITSINNGNTISANTPFNVLVQAQDVFGTPKNTSSDVEVVLSSNGTISGTTIGYITAGTNTVTIQGVTLATGTNITITASDFASILLPVTSTPFTVLKAASKLILNNLPSKGVTNQVLASFTVQALRSDNSLDSNFTGNITLNKISETGNMLGTITKAAVTGTATYSDIYFDQAGSYQVYASTNGLASTSNSSIVIIPPPQMLELIVPKYIGCKSGTSANAERTPFSICVQFKYLQPDTIYDIKAQLGLTSDLATDFGAGNTWDGTTFSTNNISHAFTTDDNGNSQPIWLLFTTTGNTTRFDAGQVHTLRVGYAKSGSAIPSAPAFIGTKTLTALDIAKIPRTTTTADDGAFLKGTADTSASGKYVLLYDNVDGTGDPLSSYQIRQTIATQTTQSDLPTMIDNVYTQSGNSNKGDYAVIIPIGANNPNGIRRIESRNNDNTIAYFNTSANGVWPSGANTTTVNNRDSIIITLTDAPLSPNTNKTINITAMLQGYYDYIDNNNSMIQAQDVDNDGNSLNKWSNLIVDTLTVQIRSTIGPDYAIEKEFPASYINTIGIITLSGNLSLSFTGYHYIIIKHWKSVETWSDSTDFSGSTINYNFYTNKPSTQFPNNMTNNISGNPANGFLIWAGDITDGNGGVGVQDGFVTLDDMFMVYDANLIVLSGYEVLDINGDGYVTLDDMFLVYDNNLVVAQVVNPITLNSKKKK